MEVGKKITKQDIVEKKKGVVCMPTPAMERIVFIYDKKMTKKGQEKHV